MHCVKSVGIQSYSSPYFPAFKLNADQNNSEYGHILRSDSLRKKQLMQINYNKFSQMLRNQQRDNKFTYPKHVCHTTVQPNGQLKVSSDTL